MYIRMFYKISAVSGCQNVSTAIFVKVSADIYRYRNDGIKTIIINLPGTGFRTEANDDLSNSLNSTLNVQGPSYPGLIRSVLWLLMHWLLG